MPNHVANKITADAIVLGALIGKDEEGNDCVDFSKVLPCPDIIVQCEYPSRLKSEAEIRLGGFIDVEAIAKAQENPPSIVELFQLGNYGAVANVLHSENLIRQAADSRRQFTEKEEALISQMISAYRQTGYMTWLDWRVGVWGTKWDAYNFERLSETEIMFETAWGAPHRVMEALAGTLKRCFLHEWADEDVGNNVGWRKYDTDGRWDGEELSGTKEGYELRFKLDPSDKEYYELVEGKYVYVEED